MKIGEKNAAVTRHAQCSGRVFEAGNWNNRKSQTVRTGRRSTKMKVSGREAKLHLVFSLFPRTWNVIKTLLRPKCNTFEHKLSLPSLQLQASRNTNI